MQEKQQQKTDPLKKEMVTSYVNNRTPKGYDKEDKIKSEEIN